MQTNKEIYCVKVQILLSSGSNKRRSTSELNQYQYVQVTKCIFSVSRNKIKHCFHLIINWAATFKMFGSRHFQVLKNYRSVGR